MKDIIVVVSYKHAEVRPAPFPLGGQPDFIAASMFRYFVVKSDDAEKAHMARLVSWETIQHMVLEHALNHGVPALSVRRLGSKKPPKNDVSENQLGLFGDGDEGV